MNATTTPTQEQIDRCERFIDMAANQVFYQVTSESSDAIYEVRYNHQYKCFTCSCPSGQIGFSNCSHGTCKHCRWSVAAEKQYQDLKAAERLAQERIERTAQYQQEQAEQALVMAERNLAQVRNATTQCADGEWW
jgi:hypothetical protein